MRTRKMVITSRLKILDVWCNVQQGFSAEWFLRLENEMEEKAKLQERIVRETNDETIYMYIYFYLYIYQ